jgi:methyltransferase-like protein/SAM-dependent methyltransferase
MVVTQESVEEATVFSYDAVPYSSYPYPQSTPDRMATIARVTGLRTAELRTARVLELGCAGGGNLIPLAASFPEAHFTGIDLSARQLASARAEADAIGLGNIRWIHADLASSPVVTGEFDYVIAHGLYSWIPDRAREGLWSLLSRHLAPNGVAYVSYNTYPGWRMRGMVRDMMKYRIRRVASPAERVDKARRLLDFLVRAVPREDNAYGMLLAAELETLRDKEDAYLLHDHLEEVNEPVYFHEFVERAAAHGLSYLAEAEYRMTATGNLPPAVESLIGGVAENVVEVEQYMDFVRNRMFRQTILCRTEVVPDRRRDPRRIEGLWVGATSRLDGEMGDIDNGQTVRFEGPTAVMTTNDRVVKGAMLHLAQQWPARVAFGDLLAAALSRGRADPVVSHAGASSAEGRRLAESLLMGHSTGQVELSTVPCGYLSPATVTEEALTKLNTSRYARWQAEHNDYVTNGRHEVVELTDFQKSLIGLLDGTRDRAGVLETLGALLEAGTIGVHQDGRRLPPGPSATEALRSELDRQLVSLARQALLAAE